VHLLVHIRAAQMVRMLELRMPPANSMLIVGFLRVAFVRLQSKLTFGTGTACKSVQLILVCGAGVDMPTVSAQQGDDDTDDDDTRSAKGKTTDRGELIGTLRNTRVRNSTPTTTLGDACIRWTSSGRRYAASTQ
jgi:hypothetical protein